MSYCVNCGVELDITLAKCPLCNTPVYNPMEPVDNQGPKPYSEKVGMVLPVKNSDTAILLSVILLSSAIACGLLNFLVFTMNLWSFYIVGICVLLWIFCIPVFIYTKISIYLSLLLDGLAVAFYIGIIAYQYPGGGWYLNLAVPIIVLTTILILIYVFCIRYFPTSILSKGVFIFGGIGILTVGIDLLIHRYIDDRLYINWSAVSLTCCVIIVAALLTIIKRSRLREEVRRRMHI